MAERSTPFLSLSGTVSRRRACEKSHLHSGAGKLIRTAADGIPMTSDGRTSRSPTQSATRSCAGPGYWTNSLKVEIDPRIMIEAVKGMSKREREAFIETLLAATSPEYLESSREARADYQAGRPQTHKDIFGE